jgi:hypothetical protein
MSITTEVLHIELEKYHPLDRIAKEGLITEGNNEPFNTILQGPIGGAQ